MGVPKLFRWLSERYPCLSEKVQEWQIPEFDNLYLDMNGIIHNCSHPNDDDVHFRITEEQIFKDIFNYIDFLFKTIKPRKVMFMAIDGVAPRAKMNQQRSRRFRTAKEAQDKEQEAVKKGESLPETARFDSNCITPGTTFMIKLQEQLKYFVVKKVSTDELWKNVKVYLSGHEAPGEGEHKIMDFIRYSKSQPDYDPYTRHCLYGLDADLIMLGSVSHEPYFSLLREEVKYVKTKTADKKPTSPEKINFYLLHLSILRDYLEIEFAEIKEKHPSLFNIENIIDDWVFMCILVGNDFIPHLPHYHINKNSLVVLYKAYMQVLPKLKGYINEEGYLNLERLEILFDKLAELEQDQYNENSKEFEVFRKERSKIKKKDKKLINFFGDDDEVFEDALEDDPNSEPPTFNAEDLLEDPDDEEDDESSTDEEVGFLNSTEFDLCKRSYYERKLNLKNVTEDIVREHTYAYIEALQWNLYYYYNGCQSWSWYYPYHYAPYVSDIRNFKDFKIKFPNDKPLLPYEQLLGVLPIASRRFLPESYQNMMVNKDSPLVDCYPTDFKLDLNGKSMPWEAIVLIPFIEENLLLQASEIAKRGLSEMERTHNSHGPHLLYYYTDETQPEYPSSLPDVFPNVTSNHAKCINLPYTQFQLPVNEIKKGISKKIKLQTHFFGFPSLKFLKFTAKIKNEKVRVFETFSRLDNVILKLESVEENNGSNLIQYLDKNIYFNWPYPKESRLVSLYDGQYLHTVQKSGIHNQKLNEKDAQKYIEKIQSIKDFLFEKRGILVEDETAICSVKPVIGYSIKVNSDGTISKEKQYSSSEVMILAKTIMPKLKIVLPKQNEVEKAVDIYKEGKKCFLLDKKYYGDYGEILNYNQQANKVTVRVTVQEDPDISDIINREDEVLDDNYMSNTQLARALDLLPIHVSKITGSVFVTKNKARFNIGLNLKFNERRQQIANYSKKINDVWFFSNEVSEIIYEYMDRFPVVTHEIFNYSKNELDYKDLFPIGDAEAQFKELVDYLKELPTTKEKKQNINAIILDKCLVSLIEETLQSSTMFLEDSKTVDITTEAKNVFCSLSSLSKTHPDPTAKFNLYDRVVNVKQGIVVPQNLRGIVIGIEESQNEAGNAMITIVFDEAFEGGLKINTKVNCAYVLPQCYLLNVSYGKKTQRSTKKEKDMFSCVLPPVKSKHHQKETFIAPKQKVEDPYYDESKNYWAKLNNARNGPPSSHYQQEPAKVKAYQNGIISTNNKQHQKQSKSEKPNYQAVWNKLMASETTTSTNTNSQNTSTKKTFDPSILFSDHKSNVKESKKKQQVLYTQILQRDPAATTTTTKESTKQQSIEQPMKLSKKVTEKINHYYSSTLKRHYKQNFKVEPKLVYKHGSNNTGHLHLIFPNQQPVTLTKSFDKNLTEQQKNEELCKLALSKLNVSTAMPPTFIFTKQQDVNRDFKLPAPPKEWISEKSY